MSAGLLQQCFDGVAVKRLSAVEADINRSNQHEFNASQSLKRLMGDSDRKYIPTRFLWMGGEQDAISEDAYLSWYDARRAHPVRSEYRFYFPNTAVMDAACEGDSVFFAVCPDQTMMVIVTPAGSTMENQLAWLFGLENQPEMKFSIREFSEDTKPATEFAVRYILEELGLEVEEPETGHLDVMLERFGKQFPATREFSAFARETLKDVSPLDGPDAALMAWMEHEEILFRRLERHLVEERLQSGFVDNDGADVDGFLKFSLSVQNRRKSRVGLAFENHLEEIFIQHRIRYARGTVTENRSKPDFLFPSAEDYHNPSFPAALLTMLGVKSTCKDRWRQVLPEAARIERKHLITLEPGISEHQTNEMREMNLQLVLPSPLHATYKPSQQRWLVSLGQFLELVKKRQSEALSLL
tara:strand:+ start:3251 stop:4486 length:1236 start_codon:yes stop_codon:yes gene_type:complete